MGRLFVVGSLNLDSVITVDRHPLPGETVLGSNPHSHWGGKGANQAVAAARAAASRSGVVLVGRVGDDANGHEYRDRLEALGVDVGELRSTPGVSTGSAVIAVSGAAENTIIVSPGANALLSVDGLSALDILDADDVVVPSLEVPIPVVVRASEKAAAAEARLVLNLSPVGLVPAEVLERADPIIVNEHEAAELARQYGDLGSVLVTRGAAGSNWGDIHVPSHVGIHVIDTTGAGDAYCGVLAWSLATGASDEESMRAATAAAAEAVGRTGAQ